MDKLLTKSLVLVAALVLLAACNFGSEAFPDPSATPTITKQVQPPTPTPTNTPSPTNTPPPTRRPRPTPLPSFEAVAISDIETALGEAGYRRFPLALEGGRSGFRWVRDNPYERVTTIGDNIVELQVIHESSPGARADRLERHLEVLDSVLPAGLMAELRKEHAAYNRQVQPSISGEPDDAYAYADEFQTVWGEYYNSGTSIGNYDAEFSLWWWQSTCPPQYDYCYYEDFPGLEFTGDSSFVFHTVLLWLPEEGAASLGVGSEVEIVSEVTIAEGDDDPFEATGSAVGAGLICPFGVSDNISFQRSGGQGGAPLKFEMVKKFVCDDGSGFFLMELDVEADASGTNGTWRIVGGSDAYVNLEGNGTIVGVSGIPDVTITDYYSGVLR